MRENIICHSLRRLSMKSFSCDISSCQPIRSVQIHSLIHQLQSRDYKMSRSPVSKSNLPHPHDFLPQLHHNDDPVYTQLTYNSKPSVRAWPTSSKPGPPTPCDQLQSLSRPTSKTVYPRPSPRLPRFPNRRLLRSQTCSTINIANNTLYHKN